MHTSRTLAVVVALLAAACSSDGADYTAYEDAGDAVTVMPVEEGYDALLAEFADRAPAGQGERATVAEDAPPPADEMLLITQPFLGEDTTVTFSAPEGAPEGATGGGGRLFVVADVHPWVEVAALTLGEVGADVPLRTLPMGVGAGNSNAVYGDVQYNSAAIGIRSGLWDELAEQANASYPLELEATVVVSGADLDVMAVHDPFQITVEQPESN